jgi:transketolase
MSISLAGLDLDAAALQLKADDLRRETLRMIAAVGTGHPGSSLSCMEILACLYYRVLRVRPEDLSWEERDRLVLSKGHAAPALYAIFLDLGLFSADDGLRLRQIGSPLQGHPDRRFGPIDASSGSLGQGASIAVGMALGARRQGLTSRIFALLGDGEVQEGQVWEAAMAAAHYGLDNLCMIVDRNGLQHDGPVDEVMEIEPLAQKWRAFGWSVREIDGHDCAAVVAALEERPAVGRPTALIARTVKGKGVAFMENQVHWHSVADADRLALYVEDALGA